MKVGDKVTKANGSIVWEIAEAKPAGEVFPTTAAVYGGADRMIFRVKNLSTGKISKNLWYGAEDLTAI